MYPPPVPFPDDRSQLIRDNMPLVELVVQRMMTQVCYSAMRRMTQVCCFATRRMTRVCCHAKRDRDFYYFINLVLCVL